MLFLDLFLPALHRMVTSEPSEAAEAAEEVEEAP